MGINLLLTHEVYACACVFRHTVGRLVVERETQMSYSYPIIIGRNARTDDVTRSRRHRAYVTKRAPLASRLSLPSITRIGIALCVGALVATLAVAVAHAAPRHPAPTFAMLATVWGSGDGPPAVYVLDYGMTGEDCVDTITARPPVVTVDNDGRLVVLTGATLSCELQTVTPGTFDAIRAEAEE